MDYYKILGITPDADLDAIKKSYRKLAAQYHPDKNIGDAEAAERFKEIKKAYDYITENIGKPYKAEMPHNKKPKPQPPKPKADHKNETMPHNKLRRQSSIFADAPPPKYDIWGQPLSQEEKIKWQQNNTGDFKDLLEKWRKAQKMKHEKELNIQMNIIETGWRDTFANQYEADPIPEVRN